MDRLRIQENQRNFHKINFKFRKAAALFLVVCLVFLVSCVKKAAFSSENPTGAAYGVSDVEETNLTSEDDEAVTSAHGADSSEAVITKEETTTEKESKTDASSSRETSKTTAEKKTTEKQTAKPAPKSTAKTTAKQTTKPTSASSEKHYCFVTIECKNVLKEENFKKLDTAKKSVIPSDGVILEKQKVAFTKGENVYDVFKRACQNNVCVHNCRYCQGRIQFETVPSVYGTYVKGIHYLYEKDCGTKSGWMYKVNGVFPDYAVDYCEVSDNDDIVFVYTCNMNDI